MQHLRKWEQIKTCTEFKSAGARVLIQSNRIHLQQHRSANKDTQGKDDKGGSTALLLMRMVIKLRYLWNGFLRRTWVAAAI